MNKSAFSLGNFCHVCRIPAQLRCLCEISDNITFYLCEEHLIDHLNRDGTHELEYLDEKESEKFPVELDESELESANFQVKGHTRPITSISLQGKYLISAEKDGIYKWNSKSQALVAHFRTNSQVWSVSNNRTYVAGGLDESSVVVLNFESFSQEFSHNEHQKPVIVVCFTKSAEYLISGCADGLQVVYSLENNSLYSKDKIHNEVILCMECTYDSKFVITGCKDGKIVVWDIEGKKLNHTIDTEKQAVTALSTSVEQVLVYGGFDGIIRFWDLENKKAKPQEIQLKKRKVLSLVFTSDGKNLFIADSNYRISKYRLGEREDERKKGKKEERKEEKKEEGKEENKCVLERFIENTSYVVGMILDHNNQNLYTVWGGITVKVFDSKKGMNLIKNIGHDKLVSVKKTNDNKFLVCVYLDGAVTFFDSKSGLLVHDYPDFHSALEKFEEYPELGVTFDEDEY